MGVFKENVADHNELTNGYDLYGKTHKSLTEEQWADVCLLEAAVTFPCIMRMLDKLKKIWSSKT